MHFCVGPLLTSISDFPRASVKSVLVLAHYAEMPSLVLNIIFTYLNVDNSV